MRGSHDEYRTLARQNFVQAGICAGIRYVGARE